MVASSDGKDATSFESVLGRLKMATNTFSDVEFAQKALGKGQSSISNAKGRRAVPPQWIETVSKKFGVSADWLFFGEGPMARGGHPETSRASKMLECARCTTLEAELCEERKMNRDLVKENRELGKENRQLLRENGDLRVEVEQLKARAAPENHTPESTRKIA
jgi:hypothetical protein